MFVQRAFLLSTFMLMTLSVLGQKATITGKVVDGKTSESLIGATVLLSNGEGTTSDFDGSYSLQVVPGEYELTVGYLGFESYKEKIILKAGQVKTINVELGGEVTLLQTATVTSGKYEKPLGEVTVSLAVMKPDLLESTSKPSIDQFLEKIPGVTIIDGQANIRGGSGFSQGAGSRVLLLMDDVPILQADAGYPNWDDVPVENIEQIEVVKGAASALYGSSALNGIVNVRTAFARAEPETKAAVFYTAYLSPEEESLKWWGDTLQPYQVAATLSHKRKIGKTDLVLGGFYTNQESYNKDTYKEYGRVNLGLRHRLTDRLVLGLNANVNVGRAGSFFTGREPITFLKGLLPPSPTGSETGLILIPRLPILIRGKTGTASWEGFTTWTMRMTVTSLINRTCSMENISFSASIRASTWFRLPGWFSQVPMWMQNCMEILPLPRRT